MGFLQGPNTDADHRHWVVPFVIVLIACLFALGGDEARSWFRYDRLAIESGAWWRLVTGHFTHLSVTHLVLNLAGLLLVWALTGSRLTSTAWLVVLVLVMAGMNTGFWFFDPNLLWYVGLSGLLHGLLIAGAVMGLRQARGESMIILVLVFAKILYEQIAGPMPGSELSSGGPVVVNAHLYGAVSGLLAGLTQWRRGDNRRSV